MACPAPASTYLYQLLDVESTPPKKVLPTAKTEYDAKAQTVTLCFGEELPAGEVRLRLKFEGSINDKLAGLYRSKYTVRVFF